MADALNLAQSERATSAAAQPNVCVDCAEPAFAGLAPDIALHLERLC
jgi:hypothetical protein